jgi:hypothetical protein
MEERSLLTNGPDDPAGREALSQQGGVPVRVAILRWSVGLAIGTLLVLAMSWLHADGIFAILSALGFLHRPDDRRSRWAIVTAWVTAVPVAVASALLLRGWLPQPWDGILYAGLGSLLGGVGYAAVTQVGIDEQQHR